MTNETLLQPRDPLNLALRAHDGSCLCDGCAPPADACEAAPEGTQEVLVGQRPRPRKVAPLDQATFDRGLNLIKDGVPFDRVNADLGLEEVVAATVSWWSGDLPFKLNTPNNRRRLREVSFEVFFKRPTSSELISVPGHPGKQFISQELIKFDAIRCYWDATLAAEESRQDVVGVRNLFIQRLASQHRVVLIAGQNLEEVDAPVELYCLEHEQLYSTSAREFRKYNERGEKSNGCPHCSIRYQDGGAFLKLNTSHRSVDDTTLYAFDVDDQDRYQKVGISVAPKIRLKSYQRRDFCFSLDTNYTTAFTVEQVLLAGYRKRDYHLVPKIYHKDPLAVELKKRKARDKNDRLAHLYHNGLGEVVRHPGGLQQIKRDIATVLKDIAIHGPLSVLQEAVPKTKDILGRPELEPPDRSGFSIPVIPLDMELIS